MYILKTVKKNLIAILLTAATSLCSLPGAAQSPPFLLFTPVVTSGLISPLDIINAGDGTNRLFIVGRTGRVKIVSAAGVLLPGDFLDVHTMLPPGDENGLLSMAFHPNYATNGYFFIYYLTTNFDIRITRFFCTPGTNGPVNLNTGVDIITIPAVSVSYHNGGKMNFGPDGNLYFAVGDGSPGGDPNNHAQDGNLLWGKMMRLNVDNFSTPPYYTIPSDNPYVNDPAIRDEIFAMGLRNPWRWSFDRLNHNVWLADVGEGAWEEINYRPFATSGGINYGWRCYEGTHDFVTAGCLAQSNYVFPIFEYPHNSSTGGYSVTGGHVYRGTEFSAMYGYYICSDYVSGNAWLIKPNGSGGWNISIQNALPTSIVGYGESESGVLYAVALTGTLYKVTTNSSGPLPVTLLQFTAKALTGYNELRWKTTNEQNLSYYEIQFSADGVNYTSAGRINPANTPSENNYSFQHAISTFTKLFYKIKIVDKDSRSTFSDVVVLDKKQVTSVKVYPTLIMDNRLYISSDKPVEEMSIFSTDGRKVFQNPLNNLSGTINISIPLLQDGFYIVQVKLKDGYVNEKVLIQRK
ncbi:MAG: PQQ-dependent sugar dehydrogenase [Ferruginibacter sp.]